MSYIDTMFSELFLLSEVVCALKHPYNETARSLSTVLRYISEKKVFMTVLASRRFSMADQIQFASASGDYNPMHMDELTARRLQAGFPVVHGIHLLLWALDSYAATHEMVQPLVRLRVQFNHYVCIEELVEIALLSTKQDIVRLSISVDGATRARITLEFGEAVPYDTESAMDMPKPLHVVGEPQVHTLDQLNDLCGNLPFILSSLNAETMFPAAMRWISLKRVAALAASTYLVGMICPGLHSVYTELSVSLIQSDAPIGSLVSTSKCKELLVVCHEVEVG